MDINSIRPALSIKLQVMLVHVACLTGLHRTGQLELWVFISHALTCMTITESQKMLLSVINMWFVLLFFTLKVVSLTGFVQFYTIPTFFLPDVTLNAIACAVISIQSRPWHLSNYVDMKNTEHPPAENKQQEKWEIETTCGEEHRTVERTQK